MDEGASGRPFRMLDAMADDQPLAKATIHTAVAVYDCTKASCPVGTGVPDGFTLLHLDHARIGLGSVAVGA
jgi:hypothetical protein